MIEFSISQFSVPAFPEQKPFWELQLQTMFFYNWEQEKTLIFNLKKDKEILKYTKIVGGG